MKINGLVLPDLLVRDLLSGGRRILEESKSQFRESLKSDLSGGFIPKLYNLPEVKNTNKLWRSGGATNYLGMSVKGQFPGKIDPTLTLIIGHIEPDSPIALDYKTKIPSIIYFATVDCEDFWQYLASSYEEFVTRVLQA